MNNLCYLEDWLNERFPNRNFSIRPIQRVFTAEDKQFQNNVLYFGVFTETVTVMSPFQVQPLNLDKSNTRLFIFSHLSADTVNTPTFIGYEITGEFLFVQHTVLPWGKIDSFNDGLLAWHWETANQTDDVEIKYSTDNGVTWTAVQIDNSGYFDLVGVSSDAMIKLVNGDDNTDMSNVFKNVPVIIPDNPDLPVGTQSVTISYYSGDWELEYNTLKFYSYELPDTSTVPFIVQHSYDGHTWSGNYRVNMVGSNHHTIVDAQFVDTDMYTEKTFIYPFTDEMKAVYNSPHPVYLRISQGGVVISNVFQFGADYVAPVLPITITSRDGDTRFYNVAYDESKIATGTPVRVELSFDDGVTFDDDGWWPVLSHYMDLFGTWEPLKIRFRDAPGGNIISNVYNVPVTPRLVIKNYTGSGDVASKIYFAANPVPTTEVLPFKVEYSLNLGANWLDNGGYTVVESTSSYSGAVNARFVDSYDNVDKSFVYPLPADALGWYNANHPVWLRIKQNGAVMSQPYFVLQK